MPTHLDYDDPRYAEAAREILRRHEAYEAEANITSAVRDFLVATELVKSEEIVEEVSPALGSRRAVDLAALDTFIEFKRRIGSKSGFDPNPEFVEQLDDYVAQSQGGGRVRVGIHTDGKYWLLRWPGTQILQWRYGSISAQASWARKSEACLWIASRASGAAS